MDLNLDYFKEYYKSGEFEQGLKRYFKITRSSNGISMILSVDRHFNDNVSMPHLSLFDEEAMEKSICFAIILYYICLCNYIMDKLSSKEILNYFLMATGWTMVSCGLGGIMSPNHTMEEADLVFKSQSANQKRALKLFRETEPFMKKELNDFFLGKSLSLNKESYQKFCKAFAPYISKFWAQADEEIKEFNFLKK